MTIDVPLVACGENLEQHFLVWWGWKNGKHSYGVLQEYVKLGLKYGWQELFDVTKYMGENQIYGKAYCEKSLQKRLEKRELESKRIEMAEKEIVWDFPEEPKPSVSRSAKWEEETREVIRKLKAGEPIE